MTPVSRDAAFRSFAAWLAMTHPPIFNALAGKAYSKGLGDWSDVPSVVDPSTLAPPSIDISSSVDVSNAATDALNTAMTPPDNNASSSSWLSSLGSDVTGAISSVGSFLASTTAPLLNTATAYFKAQANQSAAQGQQAVLQAQLQRAQGGYPAAPITYVKNPVTGALQAAYVTNGMPPSMIAPQQPLLQSASGVTAYPLTRQGLSQLTPAAGIGAFLQQYGIWIAVAAVGVFALSRMRSST